MKLTRDILALSGRRKRAGEAAQAFAGRITARRRVVWRRGDGSLLRLYRPPRAPAAAGPSQAPMPTPTALVNVWRQTILHPRTITTVLQAAGAVHPASVAVDAAGQTMNAASPALRTRALKHLPPSGAAAPAAAAATSASEPAKTQTATDAADRNALLRVRDLILERETPRLRPRHRSSGPAAPAPANAAPALPARMTHFVGRADAARSAARAPRMNAAEWLQASERPTPTTLRRRADNRVDAYDEVSATSRPAPRAEDAPAALLFRPDLRAVARAVVARSLENAASAPPDSSAPYARASGAQARDFAHHAAAATGAAPRLDEATVASAVRRALETSAEIAPEIFIDRITAKLERRLRLEREWRGMR